MPDVLEDCHLDVDNNGVAGEGIAVIIEWHTHVYPPEEAAADARTWDGRSGPTWAGRCPMSIENVLDAQRKAGVAVGVVSNAAHYLRGKSEKDELSAVQRWSEYAAEIQETHKGELYGFATIIPGGGPAYIKETERAIRELHLKGILIHSNHKGHYPDDDEARPFWELVQDLDVPVFIHPPHVGFGEERMKEYRLTSSIGRPADLCLALGRLIVRGILEDFPGIKLVSSHGGGGICEVIGRMNYAYELQEEAFFLGSYAPMKIKHAPGHYLKKMYLDTVTYHLPATRLALDTVGVDHVVYGSDAPPLTSLKPRAIQMVKDLNLPEKDAEKVFWQNAAGLLKLSDDELRQAA
jgi:aminocarboxymuconate-semialdehyde decarboxylase